MNNKLLITFICALLFAPAVFAQYTLKQSTFGSGGGALTNENYLMAVTVGQPATGASSNDSYRAASGVWFQLGGYLTGVEQDEAEIPLEFRLDQNYPNPFNPSTTIRFALPKQSAVTLKLYNMLGRQIALLLDEQLPPGVHNYVFDAGDLPTGIYFYKIQADDFVKVRKLMLVK